MKYWKEHKTLRVVLIALFFGAGLALLLYGWRMTGKLSGLGLMLKGIILTLILRRNRESLLLAALCLYNKPFEEPKNPKSEP